MDAAAIAVALDQSRARTRLVADDLRGEREWGPRLAIVNPPRWELGHVGWFHEYWCLRRVATGRHAPERSAPILPGADDLYNSARVAHASRWTLPLPAFDAGAPEPVDAGAPTVDVVDAGQAVDGGVDAGAARSKPKKPKDPNGFVDDFEAGDVKKPRGTP